MAVGGMGGVSATWGASFSQRPSDASTVYRVGTEDTARLILRNGDSLKLSGQGEKGRLKEELLILIKV